MTQKRFAKIALSGIFLVALTAATPAFAINASTDGANAYTSGSNNAYANVKDTAKDGHPVKAQYYRLNSSGTMRTLWEKRGYGYTGKSGSGSWILKIRACEYINAWPDECSSWDDD
ncbi:hypothetical protein ACIPW9_24300 [Streptomyces sp. NPDC090052]|uniref:hypothetical protein n=1 Tax=Streptomyces sp. NPDC090052 TaxID=3365931 RepID=UPI00380E1CBB